MNFEGKQFFSIIEAAEVLGVGRSSVYRLLSSGELRATKIGRLTRISAAELESFITRLPQARFSAEMAA